MEELQEKSLSRETLSVEIQRTATPFEELDDELKLAVNSALEKKAVRLNVLDLREIASFTDFFVIASGLNTRQVQAISDEINEQLKKQYKRKAIRIEGYSTGEWVLLDYGDFIVHIFDKNAREFYDIERLWLDAGRVCIDEAMQSNIVSDNID